MIRNYILVALRTLSRNVFFFSINTVGLGVGIAACILCFVHIRYELSYDRFNTRGSQIFRIVTGDVASGNGWVKVSAPIPPLLKDQIPEIESFARFAKITYNPKITVRYKDKVFNEDNFFMGDPQLFEIFSFPFLTGYKEGILTDPNSTVISQSVAHRYFGDQDPIGKVINVNNQFDFEVAGVFQDIPFNSHMEFDFLISFENLEKVFPGTSLTGNWGQYNYFAYLILHENADQVAVVEKMRKIRVDLGNNSEFDLADLGLQPLWDIHFQDNRGNQKTSYNPRYFIVYSAIAAAILIVSFINFVNLTIAGSTKRVREVGVRKVVGAGRFQLSTQFITESLVVTLIAMGFALLGADKILLPLANNMLESQMSVQYGDPLFFISMILLLALVSISAGSYLAFFVSSLRPADALKSDAKVGSKGSFLKNFLLGIQFSISIVLIMSSIFIYRQLQFMKDKDIGMDPEQVLNVALYNQEARTKAAVLKKEFGTFSWVKSISASRFTPGTANWNQTVWWEGQEEPRSMFLIMADEKVIETLDLELMEGDPSVIGKPLVEGETRYLLNESARKAIGWDQAVGEPFTAFGKDRIQQVAGVVKDYNFRSLHHRIAPCVIVITGRLLPSHLLVRLSTDDYKTALTELQATFQRTIPDTPFEYSFLDDQFDTLYKAEDRTARIVGFLTFVAIFLALLGLYGLMTFVVQERTKEMAIRKVLGVRFGDIAFLLSGNFLWILVAANIVAVPVVWVVIGKWLSNFNYQIDLTAGVFFVASLSIWLFVLLTLSLNVFQVSRINPIMGLKYE